MLNNISRIAKNLQFLRSRSGLNRRQFCDKFEINYGRYTRYEDGSAEPSTEVLIKLSEFFQIPVDSILKVDLFNQPIQTNYIASEERAFYKNEKEESTLESIKEQLRKVTEEVEKLSKKKLMIPELFVT